MSSIFLFRIILVDGKEFINIDMLLLEMKNEYTIK